MSKINWRKLLNCWSDAMIASGEFSDLQPSGPAPGKWAGFSPASEKAIAHTEARLKLRLPHSYRQFLKISNGWWLQGTAGPLRLWSVEEIKPMAETMPKFVGSLRSPQRPEPESDPTHLPTSHYRSVIQISEHNDGTYLLNPMITPHPGEWQAAFFAAWVPGAECYDSFEQLMSRLCEAFIAAHPQVASNSRRSPARNLAKPPTNPITDPQQFTSELQRLGFFRFVSDQIAARMVREFHEVTEAFTHNNMQLLDGPFASPGAVILDESSARVVNLDAGRLVKERGRYATAMARQLLAAAGIELRLAEEIETTDSYSVRLEGVSHDYFRLRNRHPAISGGEHEMNAARFRIGETAKLLNKVLKQRGVSERFATLEELQTGLSARMRLALVLLDDELAYLLMWSPVIHNYCRPMRPDVFG